MVVLFMQAEVIASAIKVPWRGYLSNLWDRRQYV